jgi:hypothetical protein
MPSGLPMPEYVQKKMPVYIPGLGWTAFDNPQADLNLVPGLTQGRSARDLATDYVGQTSPLVQAPFAAALNRNPLTGADFRARVPASDLDLMGAAIPGIGPALFQPDVALTTDARGRRVPTESVSGFASWLANAINPTGGQANRYGLLAPLVGRNLPEVERGGSWLDQFGSSVVGIRRVDPTDPVAIRRAITDREFRLRDLEIELGSKRKARRAAGQPSGRRELPEYAEIERLKDELRELNKLARRAR